MIDLFLVALAVVLAFGGGAIRGFLGFAAGLFMLPFMTLMYGPVSAVITVALVDLPGNLKLIPEVRGQVSWRVVGALVGGTVVGAPFGTYALIAVDPAIMRQVIIGAVIVSCGIMLSGWRYRRALNIVQYAGLGFFGGIILGATYIGILIPIFLMAGPGSAASSRAYTIIWVLPATLLLVGMLAVVGVVNEVEMWRFLVLGPLFLAGTVYGSRIFKGISETLFRRMMLFFLIATSAAGLVFINL